jgi:hypothetical protein
MHWCISAEWRHTSSFFTHWRTSLRLSWFRIFFCSETARYCWCVRCKKRDQSLNISILLHWSMLFRSRWQKSWEMKATTWRIMSSIAEELTHSSQDVRVSWRRMQRKRWYWVSSDQWWKIKTCDIDLSYKCSSSLKLHDLTEVFFGKNLSKKMS